MSTWGAGELEAFTEARLDEAEAAAQDFARGSPPPWSVETSYVHDANGRLVLSDEYHWDAVRYFGRHDPSRALREVASLRAIAGMHHQPRQAEAGDYVYVYPEALKFCSSCGPGDSWEAREHPDWFDEWPCTHARLIAAIWSDHPAYKGQRDTGGHE